MLKSKLFENIITTLLIIAAIYCFGLYIVGIDDYWTKIYTRHANNANHIELALDRTGNIVEYKPQ